MYYKGKIFLKTPKQINRQSKTNGNFIFINSAFKNLSLILLLSPKRNKGINATTRGLYLNAFAKSNFNNESTALKPPQPGQYKPVIE